VGEAPPASYSSSPKFVFTSALTFPSIPFTVVVRRIGLFNFSVSLMRLEVQIEDYFFTVLNNEMAR